MNMLTLCVVHTALYHTGSSMCNQPACTRFMWLTVNKPGSFRDLVSCSSMLTLLVKVYSASTYNRTRVLNPHDNTG